MRVVLLSVMLAGFVVRAAAETAAVPEGVSPGAENRFSTIRDECPTFSWEAIAGTAFYELVAHQTPDDQRFSVDTAIDLSKTQEVLYTWVPGGATSWTPELERCLAPGGRYVWFVRAVFDESDGVVIHAGEWSQGRFFAVASAPRTSRRSSAEISSSRKTARVKRSRSRAVE